MTIEECRRMLEDVQRKKSRVRRINRQIAELKENIDALSLPSALSHPNIGHSNAIHSNVEQIVERIATRQEEFMKALDEAMSAEDRLNDAIQTLTAEEQDVIVECYMNGKTRRKVGELMGYSEETIKRRKGSAVKKIAKYYNLTRRDPF